MSRRQAFSASLRIASRLCATHRRQGYAPRRLVSLRVSPLCLAGTASQRPAPFRDAGLRSSTHPTPHRRKTMGSHRANGLRHHRPASHRYAGDSTHRFASHCFAPQAPHRSAWPGSASHRPAGSASLLAASQRIALHRIESHGCARPRRDSTLSGKPERVPF